MLKGRVKWFKTDSKTGELISQSEWKENMIMFGTYTGYDLILKRLIMDNTYTMNILYADIGTSNATPTISDTVLGAAVARANGPVKTQTGNVVSFQFFWPDASLPNGTYYEIGTFVDGSNTINTGQLFNHALFASAYTKGSSEDTTVQIDFELTSSS